MTACSLIHMFIIMAAGEVIKALLYWGGKSIIFVGVGYIGSRSHYTINSTVYLFNGPLF